MLPLERCGFWSHMNVNANRLGYTAKYRLNSP